MIRNSSKFIHNFSSSSHIFMLADYSQIINLNINKKTEQFNPFLLAMLLYPKQHIYATPWDEMFPSTIIPKILKIEILIVIYLYTFFNAIRRSSASLCSLGFAFILPSALQKASMARATTMKVRDFILPGYQILIYFKDNWSDKFIFIPPSHLLYNRVLGTSYCLIIKY